MKINSELWLFANYVITWLYEVNMCNGDWVGHTKAAKNKVAVF